MILEESLELQSGPYTATLYLTPGVTSTFLQSFVRLNMSFSNTNIPFCYSEVGRDSTFERAGNPALQCVVRLQRDKSPHLQTGKKSVNRI